MYFFEQIKKIELLEEYLNSSGLELTQAEDLISTAKSSIHHTVVSFMLERMNGEEKVTFFEELSNSQTVPKHTQNHLKELELLILQKELELIESLKKAVK